MVNRKQRLGSKPKRQSQSERGPAGHDHFDSQGSPCRSSRGSLLVCGAILAATMGVYGQVVTFEFINYDDPVYVTDNAHVQEGWSGQSVRWAFTAGHASNWHPLTWLSHMADCRLFGLQAGGHHAVNVLFHLVNTLLLFAVFQRMTGALWASGMAAALFALHPLHVESVAWVAERKDVLSTFFWLATMWAYMRYTQRPGIARYLTVALLFALGLMAKPMLVTLPLVLLLLDYWPLGRLQIGQPGAVAAVKSGPARPNNMGLVAEKLPLLALSAGSCIATYLVQQSGGAVNPIALNERLANAVVSYGVYVARMVWPVNLSIAYPHAIGIEAGKLLAAGLFVLALTAAMIRWGKVRPWLAVGGLWYLGTLVPVIGIVQVGGQALADRYTYVPLIGIFIIVAWGAETLVERWQRLKSSIVILCLVALSALTICTWRQVGYWKNSVNLFSHAVEVNPGNHRAHNNLGLALAAKEDMEKAIDHYRKVVELGWGSFRTYVNLGVALYQQGKTEEAVTYYEQAIDEMPSLWQPHYNVALALVKLRRYDQAIDHYQRVLTINPDHQGARQGLKKARLKLETP